ncbi:unnamed protein product [Bursaphelenchus xylophilus]|nr:unnamed protein product [Bursaphelenchus xylophilus]CAG9093369.1 unnamed protein product [Bursaphelenchus xylophilus]
MHAINDRAHLNLDDKIIELKNGLLNLPDDDLRGPEFSKAGNVYRNDTFPKMRNEVSMGWEENALYFEANLLDLLRNDSRQRIIDANARKFLNITQLQLTQQICEVYVRYIREDIKDTPFVTIDWLLDSLNWNDGHMAVIQYEALTHMRLTPTEQTTHGNPGSPTPHFGTSPTPHP